MVSGADILLSWLETLPLPLPVSKLPLPVAAPRPARLDACADAEEDIEESDGKPPCTSPAPTAGLIVDVDMLSPEAYLVHLSDRLSWLHSRYVPELADFVAGVRDSCQVHRLLHLLTCNLLRMLRLLLVHPESSAPSEHRACKKATPVSLPSNTTTITQQGDSRVSDNSSGLFSGLDEATWSEEGVAGSVPVGVKKTEAPGAPQLQTRVLVDVATVSTSNLSNDQSSSPKGRGGGHARRSSVMRRRRSSVALFTSAKLKRGEAQVRGPGQGLRQGQGLGLETLGALPRSKLGGAVGVQEEVVSAQRGSTAASCSFGALPYTDSDVTLHSLGIGRELASESGTFVRRLSWPHLDAIFLWALATSCQTLCPPRFLRALDAQLRQQFVARPCLCPSPPLEGLLFDYLWVLMLPPLSHATLPTAHAADITIIALLSSRVAVLRLRAFGFLCPIAFHVPCSAQDGCKSSPLGLHLCSIAS